MRNFFSRFKTILTVIGGSLLTIALIYFFGWDIALLPLTVLLLFTGYAIYNNWHTIQPQLHGLATRMRGLAGTGGGTGGHGHGGGGFGFRIIPFIVGLVMLIILLIVLAGFPSLSHQFWGGWAWIIIPLTIVLICIFCISGVSLGWAQGLLGLIIVICLAATFGFINPKKIGGIVAPDGKRYTDTVVVRVPATGRVAARRQIPKGMAPAYAMENGKVNVYSDGKKIGWVDSYRHWFDPNFEGDANREFESADGKPTTVIMWLYYIKK